MVLILLAHIREYVFEVQVESKEAQEISDFFLDHIRIFTNKSVRKHVSKRISVKEIPAPIFVQFFFSHFVISNKFDAIVFPHNISFTIHFISPKCLSDFEAKLYIWRTNLK